MKNKSQQREKPFNPQLQRRADPYRTAPSNVSSADNTQNTYAHKSSGVNLEPTANPPDKIFEITIDGFTDTSGVGVKEQNSQDQGFIITIDGPNGHDKVPQPPESRQSSDVPQILEITFDKLSGENANPKKSASQRIRDLPVYNTVQELQTAVKAIFEGCKITVDVDIKYGGGITISESQQRSVSNYFDKFKPKCDSVVFWSKCQQPLKKPNDVAVTIAKKVNSQTLSMIRNKKIRFCDYEFEDRYGAIDEFDVESSFLAAQQFKKAYFISNEGTTAGEVWTNYELPLLLRNPSVEQIIRIDATVYNDIKDLHQEKIKSAIDQKSLIVFDRDPYCQANPDFETDPKVINNLCERILNIKSVVPSQSTQRDDPSAGLE